MSRIPELSGAEWAKSSYSNTDGGDCVEWAPAFAPGGVIPVRDSKDPEGPALCFEATEWMSFVEALKSGGFPRV